jgi:hypothetical protein
MNAKQRKTLEAVFTEPLRVDIRYQDLEALFTALGAELYPSRRGSRVAVALNQAKFSYHRPHPENEIGRKTVKDVRDFLTAAGIGR